MSIDRDEVREWVFEWLAAYLKTEPFKRDHKLSVSSRLYHDIGLRGMDAGDFFGDLHEKYSVDLKDLDVGRYFHGEYFGAMDIYRFLFRVEDRTKEPLTVSHVIDVVAQEKWFDPPSPSPAQAGDPDAAALRALDGRVKPGHDEEKQKRR